MGGLLSKLKEAKNQEEVMKDKKKVILNVFQPDKWSRYVQLYIRLCREQRTKLAEESLQIIRNRLVLIITRPTVLQCQAPLSRY